MSSSLIWEVVKRQNSFLVKRDGCKFSREPGNVTGTNKHKFSGLANRRSVDIRVEKKKGKTIEMRLKKRGSTHKVANRWRSTNIHNAQQSFKSVRHVIKAGRYRRDLMGLAQKRAWILLRSIARHAANTRKAAAKRDAPAAPAAKK
jgi:large subunit ribosomal protein L28e